MLLSMTGHGSAVSRRAGVSVAVEIRTINNRFLKVSVRTGEGYTALEPQVEELVRQALRRGTVQVNVRIDREAAADDYRLNVTALESYRRQVREATGETPSIDALLALPGVVLEHATDAAHAEELWPQLAETLEEALAELRRMRADEGRAMAHDLHENIAGVVRDLDEVAVLAPTVVDGYRSRLTERLNKLLAEHGVQIQPADVVREVGVFADRTDISEEVVRLRSHLRQFDGLLGAESDGRKLDFLLQEMFREANTIGSKCNDATIARHIVDIKASLERMREMIQNIE